MQGLVLNGTNNFFDILCGDKILKHCSIKGKILKAGKEYYNPLAPGDFVLIEEDPHAPASGQITQLVPRKNKFIRRNQKLNAPQLLAANIDMLLCLTTPANPPFRPRFVDRILVQAESENIPVTVIMNKCDLPQASSVKERLLNWKQLGYNVQTVSAKTGEGIAGLIGQLHGLTVAVVGQSGVGKSSLINAAFPQLNLKTAGISYKYDRGTHTTTQGALFQIDAVNKNGKPYKLNIIDTPGIRNFSIWNIKHEEIIFHFKEMAPLAGKCKFGLSCSHEHEKGCAVLEALKAGNILQDRYDSWLLLKNEIRELTRREY